MVKVTFTLDDETVATLRRSAERLGKPQSAVVREAIADHAARLGRLSDAERRTMLKAFDALEPPKQAALQADLLALIARFNRSGDSTMVVPSEYLEVVVTKR